VSSRGADPIVYWVVVLGLIPAAAVAVWAWSAMNAKQKSNALPISGRETNDVDLGGGWTMLDVARRAEFRPPSRAEIDKLKPGAIVYVFLSSHGATRIPWMVEYVGRSGSDLPLAGSWLPFAPPAGPQMLDFGPEHVLRIA
jgi:hypothetical protein